MHESAEGGAVLEVIIQGEEMKIITRQSLANEVYKRWKAQYPRTKDEISQKLKALTVPVDADEVDRIIGNTSWTTPPSCDVCSKWNGAVIEVGQEPDYESNTAWVCLDCVKKVAQLAKDYEEQSKREVDPRQMTIEE